MITLFLHGTTIIATSKTAREARSMWKNIEQIDVVADIANVDTKLEKICKQYRTDDVIRDYKIKIKRIFTAKWRAKLSKAAKKRKWDQQTKDKISQSMKGKRNHRCKHSPDTKMIIGEAMRGNTSALGLQWCYDPVTLKQRRVKEVPFGMVTGRPPKSISRLM